MYDDDHLMQLRLNFLKGSRPKELRRLRREGELDSHLQNRADACRREAKRLVDSGETFEAQAWQWAIRTRLLETLPD